MIDGDRSDDNDARIPKGSERKLYQVGDLPRDLIRSQSLQEDNLNMYMQRMMTFSNKKS